MDEDLDPEPESEAMDTSHELDMVVLFKASGHDAEMQVMAINTLLEANGISSAVVGTSTIPSLEFQVQVPRADLAEARRLLAEAQAAGPEAADEAERASEDAV
jgi:hypothetical protein